MREGDHDQGHFGDVRPKDEGAQRAALETAHGAAAAGRLDALGATGVLALQRTIGNAAVTQLIQRALATPKPPAPG